MDQDIDRAELGGDARDGVIHARRIRDIDLERQRAAALSLDRRARLVGERSTAQIEERDIAAAPGEVEADRAADPAAAAGHQRDLPCETGHPCRPRIDPVG